MSELSFMGKLMQAMELSKAAHTGLTLTYFDVIELSGEIEALKGYIAELEGKIDQLTAHDATERQDDKLPEREVCEACGGDGSILLRDNYKGQATATVDCPYCNCTGYVKESENDRVAS